MDVMHRRVAVGELYRLPNLHSNHMRNIPAALLVEHHRRRGRRISLVPQTIFYVNEDILQLAILHHVLLTVVRLAAQRTRRILRHIDFDPRWSLLRKLDRPADRSTGARIDLRVDHCGRSCRYDLNAAGIFLAATEEQHDRRNACRRNKTLLHLPPNPSPQEPHPRKPWSHSSREHPESSSS